MLIADYYLIKKQAVVVDDLYTLREDGTYHYSKGYNPAAIIATAARAILAMLVVFFGSSDAAAAFSWFTGAFISFGAHYALSRR